MTYKEAITRECERLVQDDATIFIGYNTRNGSRMYGTLTEISSSRCLETPVAENLMTGLAVGLALEKFRPVLCFERHDFILNALDAIVNHLDKLPELSDYEFKLPVLIRAIVGDSSTLDVGEQHKQDYCAELKSMLKYTPVLTPDTPSEFKNAFNLAGHTKSGAVVIVEYRSRYQEDIGEA